MSVGNQNLQDKNRVKAVGAIAYTQQTALSNPMQQTPVQAGEWSDNANLYTQDPSGAVGAKPINRGVIPSARLAFSVNPSNGNTLSIGGQAFQFVTALGAAQTNVQVKILGTAALTLAALIDAINGTTSDTNWVEATTPFAGTIFADSVGTQLRIRYAASLVGNVYTPIRGGTPWPGVATSTALAVSGLSGTWTVANLNQSGKKISDVYEASGSLAISTAMITVGSAYIELPFTPTVISYNAQSSTGVLRNPSDVIVINGNAIVITFGGGASPNLQNGDVLTFWAQQ